MAVLRISDRVTIGLLLFLSILQNGLRQAVNDGRFLPVDR